MEERDRKRQYREYSRCKRETLRHSTERKADERERFVLFNLYLTRHEIRPLDSDK